MAVTPAGAPGFYGQSTMPTLVSQISELAYAELIPDGAQHLPELDLDLDLQDVELHVPESELEIALPGRW
jgi:hypothetical protein